MNRALRILGVLLIVVAASVSMSYAQERMSFTTSFPFRLGKVVHPAGQYAVSLNQDELVVSLEPVKGAANVAAVQTRLAEPDPASEAKVVFDKVGDLYYLSEVWMPGYDGFLLTSTQQKHTHVKVKMVKKG